MTIFGLYRQAFGFGLAAVLLAGCGGQAATPGTPMQATTQAVHERSWMTPATSGALIYASGGCDGICVLSYPQGQIVDSIPATGILEGMCSDSLGNVFVTNWTHVLEYQHGGTSPIATLALPGSQAFGCSVDPTTNNLAVTFRATSGGDVAVFENEGGLPAVYSSKLDSSYCGYDNEGNLFVSGDNGGQVGLSELTSGHSTFTRLSITGKLGLPGQIQWDGSYLTYENRTAKKPSIAQLTISGSSATVVGTTHLNGKTRIPLQSWIYGGQVILPYSTQGQRANKIGLWSYPQGGKPVSVLKFADSKHWDFQGVTLSVGS